MEKEIAVTNTNTLIFIAKLNLFHLAKNMFSEILITKQIIEELFRKESPENSIVKKELENFLKEVKVKKVKELPLGLGEASAISYCLENKIKTFLSDDKRARTIAESFDIKTNGTLSILFWNLERKKINKEECKELIERLIKIGFYIDPELLSEVMREINSF